MAGSEKSVRWVVQKEPDIFLMALLLKTDRLGNPGGEKFFAWTAVFLWSLVFLKRYKARGVGIRA